MSYSAFGIKLGVKSGDVFTDVAEVLDFDGPSLAKETNEVTHHSQGDKWRRFISGLRDGGEVSFDINFRPDDEDTHGVGDTGLIGILDTDDMKEWRITFPDDSETKWEFEGTVTGFNPSNPVEGAMTASITIKVSGKPTFGA